jgi:hypothetical protein
MAGKSLAFVAYASQEAEVKDAIEQAVHRANSLPLPVRYEPWIFNDIPGSPLASPIISRIEESDFIVADITTLNLNVIFEIGYAIGKEKRVFLVRASFIEGDKELAREAGIFDTLGYFEYGDYEQLKNRLASHIETTALSVGRNLDSKAPIYIVEPGRRDDANILLTSRVKKAGYRYRSFNPAEDVRLSAIDAVRQVAVSAGVVALLQNPESRAGGVDAVAEAHNVRAMFVVGLSAAMAKPTLLLAPVGYEVPLDVRDAVKVYRYPKDIVDLVAEFSPEVNSYSQEIEPPPIETAGILERLSIGDPTAENEMATLGEYYLRTNEYQRALRGEVNLIVGRKGSGKTALFIQVRDKIRSDKRNIVVDLKPEGYQLLKIKEDILRYLGEGARQHLITAFWEYLILLEVAYKLLEKDKNTYKFNHELHDLYVDLEQSYKTERFSVEGDFSERLSSLSTRLALEYAAIHGTSHKPSMGSQEVSKLLYSHDIRELRGKISKYLEKKHSVWILFDNLDKGWSTQGVDVIDATVLRCLIDAGRKIEREMARDGHAFHCIIFVRNDVYEHLMQNSADYGKEMRATLDWTDRDLLKEMLRLRLISAMGSAGHGMEFSTLWRTLCDAQVDGEDSADFVIAMSLMRPRNVLKIFNHARGFAANFNHARIESDDIKKGLKAFSQDLVIELDRELSDVFPVAKDLLYHLIDCPAKISRDALTVLLITAGVDDDDVEKVVEFMTYYGVLGIANGDEDIFIYDTHYDLKPLTIRAQRAGANAIFVVNRAFWPALGIDEEKVH